MAKKNRRQKLLWSDDPMLNLWILVPLSVIAIILLMIAVQFNEPTAEAYKDLILYTLVFYAIFRAGGFAAWQGLGERKNVLKNVLIGIATYISIAALGFVIGVPLSIGTSLVLNVFYRWFSAVIIEETLFRGIIQPSAKILIGNAPSAIAVQSILWTGFHLVALQGSADQMLGLFLIGCALGAVNEYGKSIIPSTTAHGIWNGLKLLVGA
jgi:membrane protease YdiL (CAAX protease family)